MSNGYQEHCPFWSKQMLNSLRSNRVPRAKCTLRAWGEGACNVQQTQARPALYAQTEIGMWLRKRELDSWRRMCLGRYHITLHKKAVEDTHVSSAWMWGSRENPWPGRREKEPWRWGQAGWVMISPKPGEMVLTASKHMGWGRWSVLQAGLYLPVTEVF